MTLLPILNSEQSIYARAGVRVLNCRRFERKPGVKENELLMPAEWAKHKATYIAWPAYRAIWGGAYDEATAAYESLARTIAHFEPVRLLVAPKDAGVVRERFRGTESNIVVISVDIDYGWVRDNGPIYVRDARGLQKIVKWRFNAWGEKHPCFENDARLPAAIAQMDGLDWIDAPLVLEGGAICVDGEGTLLTTESAVLNPNRNPGLSKSDAEEGFKRYLGATKVIWLPQGLCSDETDGHIDNLASFVAPGVVAALTCNDLADDNYHILRENLAILSRETDARGRALRVTEIAQPDSIFEGPKRLTASYINFYFVNSGVLVPVFGQSKDAEAVVTIKRLVPNRKVIPFRSDRLIVGGGGIHCVTQQWPI